MKPDDIISVVVGVVGAVGGLAGLVTWYRVERDRRRRRENDQAYEAWVSGIEMGLHGGLLGNHMEIRPEERRWAARAVSEGRLVWGPLGTGVMLPGG